MNYFPRSSAPHPFIAEEDLVVIKVLEKHKGFYRTPCKHKRIMFMFGEYRYRHVELNPKRICADRWEIYEGLHSLSSDTYPTICPYPRFSAVIPKGAEFYLGNNWDVVSSDLIVYKNLKKVEGKRTMTDFIKKLLQDAKNS